MRGLDPDPTENTADNSVIAGTSNSSSTYSYTRSTRKCKSSIGSYAIKGKIEYKITLEFKSRQRLILINRKILRRTNLACFTIATT